MTTQEQIDALVEQAAAQALQNLQHEAEHGDMLAEIERLKKRVYLLETRFVPLDRARQHGELIGSHEVVTAAAKTEKLGLMTETEETKHDCI